MVKPLSLSKKKAVKSTTIGIIAVCLFVATLFYMVPPNSQRISFVFAMSVLSSSSPSATAYSTGFPLTVTFLNGTSLQIQGELNSTDIQEIQIEPTDSYGGVVGLPSPWLCAFQFAHDYQILTEVTGETTLDLGMVDVVNSTAAFISADGELPPPNYTVPALNYPLQLNSTGYWSCWPSSNTTGTEVWTMNIDQIQSILANTTGTVNIAFNIDMTSIAYYQLTMTSGTQTGNATEQYSGPCATLQLFHEGDQLLGLQYNPLTVGLTMTGS
jgi:hypothetical protein